MEVVLSITVKILVKKNELVIEDFLESILLTNNVKRQQ